MRPASDSLSPFFWILRIGVALEFLGHGMLGLGHPVAWVSYFGVFGIGHDAAFSIMPWIGGLDVTMAVMVLVFPVRALVLYLALWGFGTALLRPLAGEPIWEAIERAGNYGVPFALFLCLRGGEPRHWLRCVWLSDLGEGWSNFILPVLRLTTVLLLFGHGALQAFVHKPLFAMQYSTLGLNGASLEPWLGAVEIALALAVLVRPTAGLFGVVLIWKLGSELLSPIAGTPIWVFLEHGGSYAAPLALAWLSNKELPANTPPFAAA